jgi:hypothetical protein
MSLPPDLLHLRTTLHEAGLRLRGSQGGFILVEELVSIGLVATGIVLLLATISTGALGVTTQQEHMIADGLARSQLELIQDAPYADDHTTYPTVSVPPGFTVNVDAADWDSTAESFTGTTDAGMQLITVTVSRAGDMIIELQGVKVLR